MRSGIGWLRAGVEWSRPAYQISPYVAVPLVTWADVQGEPIRNGPRPDRARFGLRLALEGERFLLVRAESEVSEQSRQEQERSQDHDV